MEDSNVRSLSKKREREKKRNPFSKSSQPTGCEIALKWAFFLSVRKACHTPGLCCCSLAGVNAMGSSRAEFLKMSPVCQLSNSANSIWLIGFRCEGVKHLSWVLGQFQRDEEVTCLYPLIQSCLSFC